MSNKKLHACVLALAVLSGDLATAEDIDIEAVGCPEFPVTANGLTLTIVINENGTVEDCRIRNDLSCATAFDPRSGFLCISLKADARPTITQVEGPRSQRVERVTIDGREFSDGAEGYPHLHLRDAIGTGPSESSYDVVVHTTVGEANYVTTLGVITEAERSITFDQLTIEKRD